MTLSFINRAEQFAAIIGMECPILLGLMAGAYPVDCRPAPELQIIPLRSYSIANH